MNLTLVCEGGKFFLAFVNVILVCEGDNTSFQPGRKHIDRDPLDIVNKSAPYRGSNVVRPCRFWDLLWDHHILHHSQHPTFLPSSRLPPLHPLP